MSTAEDGSPDDSAAGRPADERYGYTFTTRDETPQEYQARTEAAVGAEGLVQGGSYRLVAGYAEHDNKFGGDATAYADSDSPLTRDEAQRIAEEAIDADARRRMASIYPVDGSEMEVRPSLNFLEVIRLLEAPSAEAVPAEAVPAEAVPAEKEAPVDPAAELSRPALEGFAKQYAASRGLAWVPESSTSAWRDPGPWFLSSLDITRSFGLARGSIGDGPDGELWYAEDAVRGPGGSRRRWIVARYEISQARRAGAISCTVRRKHNLSVHNHSPLGLLQDDGPLPRGLTETPTGDEPFDQQYVVGAAGGDLVAGVRPWAGRLFTPEFTGWLREQPYGEHGADATCFQLQGGLVCVYAAGWPGTADELDAFCGRAARIAAQVERVTQELVRAGLQGGMIEELAVGFLAGGGNLRGTAGGRGADQGRCRGLNGLCLHRERRV
jgi:hypothetical protein